MAASKTARVGVAQQQAGQSDGGRGGSDGHVFAKARARGGRSPASPIRLRFSGAFESAALPRGRKPVCSAILRCFSSIPSMSRFR